jgi:hypothetical protein
MPRPARLATLLVLLAAPALGAAWDGQEKLLRGFPLDPDGGIRIHNHLGTIRVVGWARDSVAVRGTIGKGASFFGGGTRRGIKLGVEGQAGDGASPTSITVFAPAGAVIVVRGAATDVAIEGLTGSVDVSCVTGSVTVFGDASELVAESMEGGLEITGNPGVLRAKTASGPLKWTGSSMDATLGSVSGRVELLGGPLNHTRIETISGDVVIDATLRSDAAVVIESHSGAVTLRATAGIATRITADAAKVGGDGITTSAGLVDGKRAPARVIDFGASKGALPTASVTVRSFKGTFQLLSPAPALPKG